MNSIQEQIEKCEVKIKLLEVILNLLENEKFSKEDAALEIAKVIDFSSADNPATTYERLIKNSVVERK